MNMIPHAVRIWWRQMHLNGDHMHLRKDKRWGLNGATFAMLGNAIEPLLKEQYARAELKAVTGVLHTRTIDELVADQTIVLRTIEQGSYVDERLAYNSPVRVDLYGYFALASGAALSPRAAWTQFHKYAIAMVSRLDDMLIDEEDETDRFYYTNRYASVLTESYEVYRLFARLVGLNLPSLLASAG